MTDRIQNDPQTQAEVYNLTGDSRWKWHGPTGQPSSLLERYGKQEISNMIPNSNFFSLIPEIGQRMGRLRTGRSIDWTGTFDDQKGSFAVNVNYTTTQTTVKVFKIEGGIRQAYYHAVLNEVEPKSLGLTIMHTDNNDSKRGGKANATIFYKNDKQSPHLMSDIRIIAGERISPDAVLYELAYIRDTVSRAVEKPVGDKAS